MSATNNTACPQCGSPRAPGAGFCTHCGSTFAVPTPPTPARQALRRRFALRGDATDLLYIALAALLAVVISALPVVNAAVYPFRLFETFVHEWSHAVVALATGGDVQSLQINPNDLSGVTWISGGWSLLIDSAGYVGAAVFSALLLLAPTRYARQTLIFVGAASALMPIVATVSLGTSFPTDTWVWAFVFSAGILAVAYWGAPRVTRLFQQFLAVELSFKALYDLLNLGYYSIHLPNATTDATIAEGTTHVPPIVWTILWSILALVAIGYSVRTVIRRSLVA